MTIWFTLGQDMPDRNQQSASDSDNGFAGMLDFGETLVLSLPVWVTAHGTPGSFDQGPSEFTATFFGDGFVLVFLATVMDTGTQASITNFFGVLKREISPMADRVIMEKSKPKPGICMR